MSVPSEYRRALLAARNRTTLLGRATDQRLIDAFLDALLRLRLDVESGRVTAARGEALRRQLMSLLEVFEERFSSLTQRALDRTVDQVLFDHAEALRRLGEEFNVSVSFSFDRVNAAVFAQLARVRGARDFRSLLRRRLRTTVLDSVDALVAGAVGRGVSAGELTQDLVRILLNDNPRLMAAVQRVPRGFTGARLGLRDVDFTRYGVADGQVSALRSLYTDARRIAVSEINNTLRETNAQAMFRSPVVLAAHWQLSGRHPTADICDYLATADQYGFGPGFHPPEYWPVAPHPHCGCYQGAVLFREPREWSRPRPEPPRGRLDDRALSRLNLTRVREQASAQLREQASARRVA